MEDRLNTYEISVHPSRINVYFKSIPERSSHKIRYPIPEQFKDNYHQNKISPVAKRKISRAIDYLIFNSRPKRLPNTLHGKGYQFRLNFITLTLSSEQIHSDQEIKHHLLNQFLIELPKKWNVRSYIWRAEKQKNGNIHFHIITDKFIPWLELRNSWNRIQQKLGYVTRYRSNRLKFYSAGFKMINEGGRTRSRNVQLRAYKYGLRTGWQSPNSTDVHAIKKINNIRAYFIKYLTKSDADHDLAGRLWGCSTNLTHLAGGITLLDSSVQEDLEKIAAAAETTSYHSDYYHVYYIDFKDLQRLGCKFLILVFFQYLQQKFPDLYPASLFT